MALNAIPLFLPPHSRRAGKNEAMWLKGNGMGVALEIEQCGVADRVMKRERYSRAADHIARGTLRETPLNI